MKYLRTSDLARAVGVHPNTVRRYVEWGLLPPVERDPNRYRRFTQHHLDCLRVAHMIYSSTYPGRAFRQSASQIIRSAVANEWHQALQHAHRHLALVQSEQAQAETAVRLLEQWAAGGFNPIIESPMQIGQAARRLNISIDVLRNWERNGFITVPRSPQNGYRVYGAAEISRLYVIRLLTRAGFSHMAILRTLLQLDRGAVGDVRQMLDTPAPNEDVYVASDRWLSTLAEQEQMAHRLIVLIDQIIDNQQPRGSSSN
jgi:DNA-binding transcriptional MerR regulator